MWKITTCSFTLQEVLIMAAMNVAPALKAPDQGKRTIGRSSARKDSLELGDCHGKSNRVLYPEEFSENV